MIAPNLSSGRRAIVTATHTMPITPRINTAKRIAESLNISPGRIKKIRAGGIIGTHEILFGFPFQTVRLKHESISREAFGNGALFAALNLQGKTKTAS